jgi:hypothetical protein
MRTAAAARALKCAQDAILLRLTAATARATLFAVRRWSPIHRRRTIVTAHFIAIPSVFGTFHIVLSTSAVNNGHVP